MSYRPLACFLLQTSSGHQVCCLFINVSAIASVEHCDSWTCKSTMNAQPSVIPQQSAFGINELTTQLVLRLVDDDELLACGCVCKLLERTVDDAREGNILRARRHRRAKSPWHVDTAHGDNDADGTRRRPLQSIGEALHLSTWSNPGGDPFGEVVVHCASSGCPMRACAADGCGDAVCVYHGSGVGEIIATGTIPIPHLRFEPSRCRHMGCQNVYCTVHHNLRLGRCDICQRKIEPHIGQYPTPYDHVRSYCAAHRTRCRGARWRHDTGRIPRMKRWWTQRGSAAGEDPEFGALHECAYTLCEECMRDHKCGDMADLEAEAEDDY